MNARTPLYTPPGYYRDEYDTLQAQWVGSKRFVKIADGWSAVFFPTYCTRLCQRAACHVVAIERPSGTTWQVQLLADDRWSDVSHDKNPYATEQEWEPYEPRWSESLVWEFDTEQDALCWSALLRSEHEVAWSWHREEGEGYAEWARQMRSDAWKAAQR